MKNPSKFPILSLPIVAIEEILKSALPFDIINFSKTSSKCKRVVQYCTSMRRHHVFVLMARNIVIGFQGNGFQYGYRMICDKSEAGIKKKFINHSDFEISSVFCNNRIDKLKECSGYIKDVLKTEFHRLVFNIGRYPYGNKEIIDWFKSQSPVIHHCSLTGRKVLIEDVIYFLEQLKFTESLYCKFGIKEVKEVLPISISVKQLIILHANWISLETLMKFECVQITLCRSIFTDSDLNVFLKSWIASNSNKDLQYLRLHDVNSWNLEVVFKGIHVEGEDPEQRLRQHIRANIQEVFEHKGSVIRTIDGTIADIYIVGQMGDFVMEIRGNSN